MVVFRFGRNHRRGRTSGLDDRLGLVAEIVGLVSQRCMILVMVCYNRWNEFAGMFLEVIWSRMVGGLPAMCTCEGRYRVIC